MERGNHPELKLLMHIPNGGKRTKIEAAILQEIGVKPGVPDLFLPVARQGFHGLWIEMKRQTNGVVTHYQQGWHKALREQGYRVEVCHGWIEARSKIMDYMGMKVKL